jgi:acetyl-CoA carboxylase carboxyltransferase component
MVQKLRDEYREDVDLVKVASELVVDAIVSTNTLREELSRRFARYAAKSEARPAKKHMVLPV